MEQFSRQLAQVDPDFTTFSALDTLQVNLGDLCNLGCSHCHVDASLQGTRIMSAAVMQQVAGFLAKHPEVTLDITGGCPEMTPGFKAFIEMTAGVKRRLLRSNLTIMAEPEWQWLPEFCRDHALTVIGSLPCYLEENVDQQRGSGVYQDSIATLKKLNTLGYGTTLELNLVYNPGGAFVPGSQSDLEAAYKHELLNRHGIVFNSLFTITNAPLGRFREQLEAAGRYEKYLTTLAERFNPAAAAGIMCRTLISVDWQGVLYNCDFNQALNLPIRTSDGAVITIAALDASLLAGMPLVLGQHCYCCTAGEGSSCTGALV